MPIFERGSSQCRAQHCWRDNTYVRARSCSLLSSFKKGKAFSLRCLSPLCFPAGGVWQTQMAMLERLRCGEDDFAVRKDRVDFSSGLAASILKQRCCGYFGYFCNAKCQRGFKSTLAFLASHEAPCRMAVFTIQVTWNYTRPASRGTCRATAVKPRPSRMSPLCPCAPYGRAVRGQGRREEDARRVVHGTTRSAFGRLNFSNFI